MVSVRNLVCFATSSCLYPCVFNLLFCPGAAPTVPGFLLWVYAERLDSLSPSPVVAFLSFRYEAFAFGLGQINQPRFVRVANKAGLLAMGATAEGKIRRL